MKTEGRRTIKKMPKNSIFNLAVAAVFISFTTPSQASTCSAWLGAEDRRIALLNVVEKAMRTAGEEILKLRLNKDFQIEQKTNFSDLKTKGDCTSQLHIFEKLSTHAATKNANYIAEEKCTQTSALMEKKKKNTEATWVLDPIDGTTNYAHGMPHFGISLALVINGEICFGAVYAPVYHEFYSAFRGHGAFLKREGQTKSEAVSVSKIDQLNSSLWITGTEGGPKPAAADKNRNTFDIAMELLPKTHDLRRTGSASLDLSAIASGKAEGYFELSEGLNWWDIAAGVILVEEAGGSVLVKQAESCTLASPSIHLDQPILYVLATNGQPSITQEIKALLEQKIKK